MPFNSLSFLVLFLPVSLLLYYLLPAKLRNGCLLVFSLLFLLIGDFGYALAMLASAVLDWLLGRRIARGPGTAASRRWLLAALCKNGLLLLTLKQYDGFPDVFYASYPALNLLVPLGLGVYFFKSISYLADLHTGQAAPQKTPFGLWLYLFFYPALPFGPAVRYRDFVPFLRPEGRTISAASMLNGFWSLSKGIFKIAILAKYLTGIWTTVSGNITGGGALTALCALLCAAFGVFFLWSGSQDAAAGLSELYGYRLPKADDYPLMAAGLGEFVRRTDRSLALWLDTYAFSPLFAGENRLLRGIVRLILLLPFRSFFRCDPPMLAVWFAGILLVLLLEYALYRPVLSKGWKGVRVLYVWVILLLCLMLFLLPSYDAIHSFSSALVRFGELSTLDALLDGMTRPLLILGLLGVLLGFSGSIQRFGRRTLLLPIHGAPWLLLPAGLLLFTCSFIFI